MSRAPSIALCAVLSVLPSLAHAERSETPPQQFKPGETVKLHSLGVKLTLPSSTGWTVAVAVDGTASWDVLRPLSGATPGLQIELSRSKRPDCNDVAASLSKDQGLVRKPTTLAPATWDPWVYEVEGRLRLCTNTIEGPVLADVSADVSSIAAADVIPVLDEVSRVLGGRRSSSPLVTKGPVVSQVGTITLAYAGVRVVVPSGWSVKTFEREGRKIDLLERFEPKDPPLYFTVRRALGKCGPERRPDDVVVERPEYLPQGFRPRVLERTKGEGAHESVLCVELGPEAVVVEVGWTRREDLLDVRTMLAHVSEIAVGVGTSFSSSTANEVLEPVDRVRATLSADAHVLTTYGRERAFGGGASLDLWTVTNASDRPFGLGAELVGGAGFGTHGLASWNARLGLGPSLALGPLVFLPLVTLGGDAVMASGAVSTANMPPAGTWSLGGRIGVRLATGFSFTLFGADQRRFGSDPAITRERRFGVALSLRAVGIAAQVTDLDPGAARGRLATLSVGYVF